MSYGSYEAVRGIDLEVTHGEILAFLGPNGAGKTTTTEILEGFRKRTGGDVRVLGADPWQAGPQWRARIGVVLQTNAPERLLTVRECLTMYAGYYPHPLPVARALELTGLAEKAASRCDQLSGGQQRRLDVAPALIGDPELIFLDEPTTGFDPSARRHTWDVIAGLRDLGKTIFLTTHFMDEAEALADRIMILAAGRIVASGTPQTIGGRDVGATVITFTVPDRSIDAAGPVIMLVMFTLNAISGIYIPENLFPAWLRDIAQVLPIRPLAEAMQAAFAPEVNGGRYFAWPDLAIVAAWGWPARCTRCASSAGPRPRTDRGARWRIVRQFWSSGRPKLTKDLEALGFRHRRHHRSPPCPRPFPSSTSRPGSAATKPPARRSPGRSTPRCRAWASS